MSKFIKIIYTGLLMLILLSGCSSEKQPEKDVNPEDTAPAGSEVNSLPVTNKKQVSSVIIKDSDGQILESITMMPSEEKELTFEAFDKSGNIVDAIAGWGATAGTFSAEVSKNTVFTAPASSDPEQINLWIGGGDVQGVGKEIKIRIVKKK